MHVDTIRRLPLYSIAAGFILATVMILFAVTGVEIPGVGLGALGMLPLAAALVDAVRLRHKYLAGAESHDDGGDGAKSDSELQEWLVEQADSLKTREQEINSRALALQQWMQFPDAIDFSRDEGSPEEQIRHQQRPVEDDPMTRHDRELFDLIEAKTRELFDSIKRDAYRKDGETGKVFDNKKIREDVVTLVSDVAAIYRPGETSPLLQTNVEALARAVGRASLRLLVAVENLPGGLASYDFQTLYTLVIRAVKTFGLYKSAKPYLDVASGVLFAGRVASASNPLTLVAWWAASKATTYGASKLGSHLLDQQTVGLIRQLVEIVAIEVASIYSPMVRYRDIHWIYGVELVHMASELTFSDSARVEAMKQLAALNLRDEYGRVSLMRHLAAASTSRPSNYNPPKSLSAADRMIVAERLEAFLLAHVIGDEASRNDKSSIEDWKASASERLEIQFHGGQTDATPAEQIERCILALAAFALHHFDNEVEQAIQQVEQTRCWELADQPTRAKLTAEILDSPPFLYHPPAIDPEGELGEQFLDDLVMLAAAARKPAPPEAGRALESSELVVLPPWSGEEAIRLSAYALRADAGDRLKRYCKSNNQRLLKGANQSDVSRPLGRAIEYLIGRDLERHSLRCVYPQATIKSTGQAVHLVQLGSTLVCFSLDTTLPDDSIAMVVQSQCELADAVVEKVSGYLRSDCRVRFADGTEVNLTGSTLSGYDAYFAPLLK